MCSLSSAILPYVIANKKQQLNARQNALQPLLGIKQKLYCFCVLDTCTSLSLSCPGGHCKLLQSSRSGFNCKLCTENGVRAGKETSSLLPLSVLLREKDRDTVCRIMYFAIGLTIKSQMGPSTHINYM